MTLIQCPSCKIDNPLAAKLCIACNFRLIKKCPQNCMSKYAVSANFCSNCGCKLEFTHELSIKSDKSITVDQPRTSLSTYIKESVLKVKVNIVEGENKSKVDINDGGGWRTIKLLNRLNFSDIQSKIIDLYFPDGDKINKLGAKTQMKIDLLDFKKEPIDLLNDKTILSEYQEKYGLTTSRTYFYLWLKKYLLHVEPSHNDIKENETLYIDASKRASSNNLSSSSSSSSDSDSTLSSSSETVFKRNLAKKILKKTPTVQVQNAESATKESSDESVEELHPKVTQEAKPKAAQSRNPTNTQSKELVLSVRMLHTRKNNEDDLTQKFDKANNSLKSSVVQTPTPLQPTLTSPSPESPLTFKTKRIIQTTAVKNKLSSLSSSSTDEESSSSSGEDLPKKQQQTKTTPKTINAIPTQKHQRTDKTFDVEHLSDDSIEILTSHVQPLKHKIPTTPKTPQQQPSRTSFSGVKLNEKNDEQQEKLPPKRETSFTRDPDPELSFDTPNAKDEQQHYQSSTFSQRKFNAKQNFRYDDKSRNYQNTNSGSGSNTSNNQASHNNEYNNQESSHIVKKIKLTETTMYKRNETHFRRENNNFNGNRHNHAYNYHRQKPSHETQGFRRKNHNNFRKSQNQRKYSSNSTKNFSNIHGSDDSDMERQSLKIKTVRDLK